jgi:hypothetical protein
MFGMCTLGTFDHELTYADSGIILYINELGILACANPDFLRSPNEKVRSFRWPMSTQ